MLYRELSQVPGRLEKIACPVCLHTRFSVILRCDLSPGQACTLVGECQHCSTKFDILNVQTIDELCDQAERRFSHRPCVCGGATRLQFLCDLETQDCYFVSVCSTCGSRRRILPADPEKMAS
jgi:hypothetical protein